MKWMRFIAAGILAGIVIWIVSFVVGAIVQAVAPYDVFALGGMREVTDPIMMWFLLYSWVIGFAMAIVYEMFKHAFKGRIREKAVKFGIGVWVVATIPSAFVIYTSMNYPVAFVANNLIGGLIYSIFAAAIIVWVMK